MGNKTGGATLAILIVATAISPIPAPKLAGTNYTLLMPNAQGEVCTGVMCCYGWSAATGGRAAQGATNTPNSPHHE
ncbi:MAG: hypothetical protein ACR2P3_09445, partial [Geminicoccaceae bacterium]